jgi:GH25 family lysozyme M1 (1,4-beta-N-acetylmuramidase)
MRRVTAAAVLPGATLSAVALVIALLTASGPAAASGLASAAQAGVAQQFGARHDIDHFNEAAPHSPQFERMLAAGVARSPKAARSGPAAGTGPSVQGVDVSSRQHPLGKAINWADVARDGYKFAFIKVTEGSYYVNPYYRSDSKKAQAAGLFMAPYIFAIPNYSGGALQADYGLDAAGYTPGGAIMTPLLDLEDDPYITQDGTNDCYGLTPAQMVGWIKAFVTEIHRRTSHLPAFYTSAAWWDECTKDSKAFTADPLWIADPNKTSAPKLPKAWSTWTYWQYANDAVVPGITSPGGVDVDYISPSAIELAAPASQSDAEGSTVATVPASALNGTKDAVLYTATGLPPGLVLDSATGAITGTLPSRTGTFAAHLMATAGTASSTQALTWYVHGTVSFGSLRGRTGLVGAPVLAQILASDGLAGCTLRFSASGLPHGLSMSDCGLVEGWLQAYGRYTVTVRVTDSSGAVLATRSFGWVVRLPGSGGPTGQIQLVRDGKCLTELSKTDLAIEPCAATSANRAKAQHWTLAGNGAIRLHGVGCLNAAHANGSRAPLSLSSCAGGGQRWQIRGDAVLRNLTDYRCLADGGTKNGSRAYAEPCQVTYNNTGSASKPSKNEQWTAPAGALLSGITPYCASDAHSATQKLALVTLRGCGRATATPWTVEPDGALSAGGKCLGLSQNKTAPGTAVRLLSCGHSAQQVWQLLGGPIGRELLNPVSGLCLGDPRDRAVAGAVLAIEPCVDSDPGVWWRVS